MPPAFLQSSRYTPFARILYQKMSISKDITKSMTGRHVHLLLKRVREMLPELREKQKETETDYIFVRNNGKPSPRYVTRSCKRFSHVTDCMLCVAAISVTRVSGSRPKIFEKNRLRNAKSSDHEADFLFPSNKSFSLYTLSTRLLRMIMLRIRL